MANKFEFTQRVSAREYRAAPERDRTSFVTGMIDMLSFMVMYVAADKAKPFQAMIGVTVKIASDDLRTMFDNYVDSSREWEAAASANFVTFLDKRRHGT
jgi:hypothetical protein